MTKNQDRCILLFVKYPEKGSVKHRLSVDLSEEIVQEIYTCFVRDTLSTVQNIDAQLMICFLPVDALERFRLWLGSTLLFLPQKGQDLGERMKNSFLSAFTKGFRCVILMGSDSPDLPEKFLKKAFTELQTHDMVLGPSSDGGYYLIGFRDTTFDPGMFDDVQWGTPSVLAETIRNAKRTQHHVCLLPVWSDVDTASDLKNLIRRNRNTSFKSSMTISYLYQQKIFIEDDNAIRSKK